MRMSSSRASLPLMENLAVLGERVSHVLAVFADGNRPSFHRDDLAIVWEHCGRMESFVLPGLKPVGDFLNACSKARFSLFGRLLAINNLLAERRA